MATCSSPDEYQKSFDTGNYISTEYQDVDMFRETMLKGLHELYLGGKSGLKILEIGCGPVIAFQISAAPFASEIVMADLVQSNRDAVQLWLDKSPNAHDWTPFFRYVVQTLEGKGEEEIVRREEQLRKAVKTVVYCNALEDPPVLPGYEGPYDVVLESAVLCDICFTEGDLSAGYGRLSKLLKPGGRFVGRVYMMEGISSTSYTYQLGGTTYRCMAPMLSEQVLCAALTQAGFSDINITRSPADHDSEEIKGIGATYFGVAFISAIKAN